VALGGGGGDRTRVPRYFRACFYVCSRLFESRSRVAKRQAARRTSRELDLTISVLGMTDGDPELATDFWDSPAKARSRDYPCLGSQYEVFLGK